MDELIIIEVFTGQRWFVTQKVRDAVRRYFEVFTIQKQELSRLRALNLDLEKQLADKQVRINKLKDKNNYQGEAHSLLQEVHKKTLKVHEDVLNKIHDATSILENVLAEAVADTKEIKKVEN